MTPLSDGRAGRGGVVPSDEDKGKRRAASCRPLHSASPGREELRQDLAKEVTARQGREGPLLPSERRQCLDALQEALAGLEEARVVLASAVGSRGQRGTALACRPAAPRWPGRAGQSRRRAARPADGIHRPEHPCRPAAAPWGGGGRAGRSPRPAPAGSQCRAGRRAGGRLSRGMGGSVADDTGRCNDLNFLAPSPLSVTMAGGRGWKYSDPSAARGRRV